MNILEVRHLHKRYKEVCAVKDLSFDVTEGELFGFLGINGAGKSTTIQMLSTLLSCDFGDATICGYALSREQAQIRKCIGVVAQTNMLDDQLTVQENLIVRGSLYETDKKKIMKRLEELLDLFDLTLMKKRRFIQLSGGEKRRCEIASALMHAPRLLFLDEPTTGLDPATRKNVWACIDNLRKTMQMTVFLTTHYMEEAAKANHIAIIDHGELLVYGTPYELKEQYGKDQLILIPKDIKALLHHLDQNHMEYQEHEHKLHISLPSTMDAYPILNQVHELLQGFEVIQGTMDDIFLNVTGKASEISL